MAGEEMETDTHQQAAAAPAGTGGDAMETDGGHNHTAAAAPAEAASGSDATGGDGGVKRPLEGDGAEANAAGQGEQKTEAGGDGTAQPPRRRERKKKSGWDSAPQPGTAPGVLPPGAIPGAASVLTLDQMMRLERARQYMQTQLAQPLTMTPDVVAANPNLMQKTPQEMQETHERQQRHRAMQIMCRIYVGNIPWDSDEAKLQEDFGPFGSIKNISMSKDHTTGKHKGYAFVEYEAPEGALLAIEQMAALGGKGGYKVGRPNNAPQAISLNEEIVKAAMEAPRIYVASINEELTEEQIKEVFEAFGEVKSCQLAYDLGKPTHKGYGYIEYVQMEACQEAVTHMNLFDLGGQLLRVCRATTPEMPEFLGTAQGSRESALAGVPPPTAQGILGAPPPTLQPIKKEEKPQQAGAAAAAAGAAGAGEPKDATAAAQAILQKAVEEAEADELERQSKRLEDDDEDVAIAGSSQRFLLMQKLAKKAGDRVIVLRNMVDASEVDSELEGEVAEECSQFGRVERVIVYQGNNFDDEGAVKIFVQFEESDAAQKGQKALDGRWFGGRRVVAEMYDGARFAANDLTG